MVPGILLTFFTTNTYIFMGSFVISVLGLVSTIVCYAPYIMEIYGIQESVILGGIMNIFSRFSEVITTIVAFVVSLFYNKEEILLPYRIMYIVGSDEPFTSHCCVSGLYISLQAKLQASATIYLVLPQLVGAERKKKQPKRAPLKILLMYLPHIG